MLRQFKVNLPLCVRTSVLVILIWIVILYRYTLQTPVRIEKTPGIVYMLQWTPSYTEPLSYMEHGLETFVRRKCPVFNCYVTSYREHLGDITNFDVLLFHGKEIILDKSGKNMPVKRTSNQKYVFASMESSGYYPVKPNIYDRYFNLTWTYKLDSDINFGYFVIRNRYGKVIGPSEDINWLTQEKMLPINQTIRNKIAHKNIAAAWFVSNCDTPSKRQQVAKEIEIEMREYGISLDVYGHCGNKKCPRNSMNDCFKLIEKDYYFYFAFENSFAEDYVTEKLLHALNHYAVPVVFGGANYTRFMPDGAYLDARTLGPKELAKKMFDIIIDPKKYYEFFKWHSHYSYHDVEESPDTDPFCNLCKYLNRMEVEKRSNVVYDFDKWWNPRKDRWITFYN